MMSAQKAPLACCTDNQTHKKEISVSSLTHITTLLTNSNHILILVSFEYFRPLPNNYLLQKGPQFQV